MAQTPEYWQQQVLNKVNADSTLAPYVSISAYDFITRIAYCIGVVASAIDNLMDTMRANIDSDLAAMMPHQEQWYRYKALQFLYGYSLPAYSDTYDYVGLGLAATTEFTDDEKAAIAALEFVKYAAVQSDLLGRLILKVAGSDGTNRIPLTTPQFTSFVNYMEGTNSGTGGDASVGKIKDAGVWMVFINTTGDMLKIYATVYYNPQLMNPDGTLATDHTRPVDLAIDNYLNNLPFNGELKIPDLEDAIQAATGVTTPHVDHVYQQPILSATYTEVIVRYTPYAGYFNIDTNFPLSKTITYIAEP